MVLFNITFSVSLEAESDFERHLKTDFLNLVKDSNTLPKTFRLLTELDSDSQNYSVQYLLPDLNAYQIFVERFLPIIINNVDDNFKGQYAYFPTVLEEI